MRRSKTAKRREDDRAESAFERRLAARLEESLLADPSDVLTWDQWLEFIGEWPPIGPSDAAGTT